MCVLLITPERDLVQQYGHLVHQYLNSVKPGYCTPDTLRIILYKEEIHYIPPNGCHCVLLRWSEGNLCKRNF